ncbi:MAG: hypothetical protein P8183_14550 [Anaerolineae bacterium]
MEIPHQLRGLKTGMILLGVYTAVWITLEGALWRVVVMGVGYTAVALGYGWQKWLGGRVLNVWRWWGVTAVTGLLFGLGSGLLTLIFMIIKTGLHAHGPEFIPAEINWILQQIPIWAAAGLLTGLGLALLFKGRS